MEMKHTTGYIYIDYGGNKRLVFYGYNLSRSPLTPLDV